MKRKVYIVWNAARTEGVVFAGCPDSYSDAYQCVTGDPGQLTSTLGDAFAELYDDETRTLQSVEIEE